MGRNTGFREALITAPVPAPSSIYRPCGRVGVVLGQGALSGIWVRAPPSGPSHGGIQGAGISGFFGRF